MTDIGPGHLHIYTFKSVIIESVKIKSILIIKIVLVIFPGKSEKDIFKVRPICNRKCKSKCSGPYFVVVLCTINKADRNT